MRSRNVVTASFLVTGFALLASGCRGSEDGSTVRLSGRLEAPMVDLAPKVSGRVVEVKVREGDRVKAGDLLVTLDLGETAISVDRDRASVDSAEARFRDVAAGSRAPEIDAAVADVADRKAALDFARKELARQTALLEKKVAAPRDVDQARTTVDRAAAALKASEERLALLREGSRKFQTEQARTDVGRARTVLRQSESVAKESEIRAPADGVVLHRMAEPGLLVGPGQPALTLAFANRLYVRTYVPETRIGRVRPGLKAEIRVDAFPGRVFVGTVTEISPDAEFTPKPVETQRERVNLVYAAKVDLDGAWKEPLVPGQPADVLVRIAEPGK